MGFFVTVLTTTYFTRQQQARKKTGPTVALINVSRRIKIVVYSLSFVHFRLGVQPK